MPRDYWDEDAATRYDEDSGSMFDPEVLDPTVDLLAELAGGGGALEFAVGTGRVALPLAARGVPVSGIELSPSMAERLRAKDDAQRVQMTIGDMATTRVDGSFRLVYLVFNAIGNPDHPGPTSGVLRERRRPPGAWRLLPDRGPHS